MGSFLFHMEDIITKVDAIKRVMEDNGGKATLQQIYEQAGRYYPDVDRAKDWKAGLSGVLYREIRNQPSRRSASASSRRLGTFEKIDKATYGLINPFHSAV